MKTLSSLVRVSFGVQARTTSHRLPNKIFKKLGEKYMIELVLDACKNSSKYMNRHTHRTGIQTSVSLLIPDNDIGFGDIKFPGVNIIKGQENDVLSRYVLLQKSNDYNYIVRITADCPLIKSAIITKAVTIAVNGNYDYVTNAMPDFRTFYDGTDVEVLSKGLLNFLDNNASGIDREHVTSYLVKNAPKWAKIAHLFSNVDFSDQKLSVDTIEDFNNVKDQFESVDEKIKKWSTKYGQNTCHRF